MKAASYFLMLLLSGCTESTNVIHSGSYGPFSIGDDKQTALIKLQAIEDLTSVVPVIYPEIYIENPNSTSISSLDNSDGLLIWLNHHPFPLRVELSQNKVTKKWGAFEKCIASQQKMNIACQEIIGLNTKIELGMTRNEVYEKILNYRTTLSKQIGNFLIISNTIGPASLDQQKAVLLQSNGWRFSGLEQQSKYSAPYYSEVTIGFKNNAITEIKHWSSPHELP